MNDFIKRLLGLISDSESVNIEDMLKYLQELKLNKQIEKMDVVQFNIVETKANDGGLYLKAIASTPSLDRGDDIVVPTGITTPNAKNGKLPMLHQHNADLLIGSWDKWYVENNQFIIEGNVAKPITNWQKDVYAKIMDGSLNGISIGFMGLEVSMLSDTIRKFDKIELLEVSVVTIPMNQDCVILDVIPNEGKSIKSVESEEPVDAPLVDDVKPEPSVVVEPALDDVAISALKEEISKITLERDALKLQVESLEAELVEADTLLGEAAEQVEELLKQKGVKK